MAEPSKPESHPSKILVVDLGGTRVKILATGQTDYVMLGGGNAEKILKPPPWSRIANNRCAFRGGYRLWGLELTPTLTPDGRQEEMPVADREWRMF